MSIRNMHQLLKNILPESDNLFATKANQLGLSIISSCASLTHVLLVHLACLFLIISLSVSDISGTDHGLHDCMGCSKSIAATVGTVIKLLDSFRPVIRISLRTADTHHRKGNMWSTRIWYSLNSFRWLLLILPPVLYTVEHRLSDKLHFCTAEHRHVNLSPTLWIDSG